MKETVSSLTTVLLAIFIVLKLVGSIAWSWWLVLSPFWIPLGLALVIVIVLRIVILITKI